MADAVTLWATLILGTVLGTLAGLALALPDFRLMIQLNQRYPWGKRTLARIFIESIFTLVFALVISTALTLLSNTFIGYKEPVQGVLVHNALIFCVANLLLITILEGWLFFYENERAKAEIANVSHELLEIRFEVLKKQIDPHFIFNNLNVLSALIDSKPKKAQRFIDTFSDVYRYILDTIDQPLVRVSQELDFVESYLEMQQIRHGNAIEVIQTLPASLGHFRLPPFALQTVLENAIKHNVADIERPLRIDIRYVDSMIEVSNSLFPPISSKPSSGLGQSNLIKRYALIGAYQPTFVREATHYRVRLPILPPQDSQ